MNYNAVNDDVGDIRVVELSERHEWALEPLIWIRDEAWTVDESVRFIMSDEHSQYLSQQDAVADVAEEYRECDFARLSVNSDVTQGNDVLLAAYHAGIEIETDFGRVMGGGTGGSGLWEREWLDFLNREAGVGYEARDVQAAMCFAHEVASPYLREVLGVQSEFCDHTDAGIAKLERAKGSFRELLMKRNFSDELADSTVDRVNELLAADRSEAVTQYVNDYPESWVERSKCYVDTLKSIHELGEHQVLMGLIEDDPGVVMHGRAVMQYAADSGRDMNDADHNVSVLADALYKVSDSDDLVEKVVTYVKVHQIMDDLFFMADRSDSAVAGFVSRVVLDKEYAEKYHDNLSVFFDLDPLKSGGIASAMREISIASYGYRSGGPLVDAQEALAARDHELVVELMYADRRFNEAMHAVAFYNEPRMDQFRTEAKALVDQLESTSADQAAAEMRQMAERAGQLSEGLDHPMSQLEAAMRSMSAEHYMNVADSIDKGGKVGFSDVLYGHMLEKLSTAEECQQALDALHANPQWRAEVAPRAAEMR